MKKRIGIVAKKLSHSLSPLIHNYWIKKNKFSAEYVCFEIKENELTQFYNDFKVDKSFLGFNITVPYKENLFDLCDNVSKKAKLIGSINLIYKNNNSIYGNNTDYTGFEKTYNKLINKKIKKVLLIGAGGAARSILKFLNDRRIKHIDILSRTLNKKASLARSLKFKNFYIDVKNAEDTYDLIINASDAGMQKSKLLSNDVYRLAVNASFIIDIIYNPLHTKLINVARTNKIPHAGGLNMLLEQAKPSFESWFKAKADISQYLKNKLISKLNDE